MGINVGQNMQAAGISELGEDACDRPWLSRQWVAGQILFILFSLLNFAAFALAPASILTPLESIQFVTNVFYNRFINHLVASRGMLAGVALAVLGSALSVTFGAQTAGCRTLGELSSFWLGGMWWSYLVGSIAVALIAFAAQLHYRRLQCRGEELSPVAAALYPVTFSTS